MAKFLMLGKYSLEGIKGSASARTQKVVGEIEKNGGNVDCMYALLGCYDLVFIVDFPSVNAIMRTSISLTKLTGISFTTSSAIAVEDFDKLTG